MVRNVLRWSDQTGCYEGVTSDLKHVVRVPAREIVERMLALAHHPSTPDAQGETVSMWDAMVRLLYPDTWYETAANNPSVEVADWK
ncbi:MAG: hypothetical protein OJF49_001769 [Ktedonobacterales bacterium]|jgi:hypothetical protein|nr:MAG: hypothetical protein OJF49_001769 [Ktedonobacterales bacterium]